MTTKTASFGQFAAPGARMIVGLADAMLAGVDPAKAGTKPEGVDCVTPVFIIGHLAIYPEFVLQFLGRDEADVDEKYEALFKHGVECHDDPNNEKYPPLSDVVERFKARSELAIKALEEADDELLARENPMENMREKLPTIGAMCMFLLAAHTAFHIGQLSTWRRCMGLGPAM